MGAQQRHGGGGRDEESICSPPDMGHNRPRDHYLPATWAKRLNKLGRDLDTATAPWRTLPWPSKLSRRSVAIAATLWMLDQIAPHIHL